MLLIALKMLLGDRAKYLGLLLGITFTAFLVTFAAAYFAGFMTRGFALISENGSADIWVMDPAVASAELTINIPDGALQRVRSVAGVRSAATLSLGEVAVRFPNGRFQTFQVIGVDDATLTGVPKLIGNASPLLLHGPDAVIVDAGGTHGKLETPVAQADQWPHGRVPLGAATRSLRAGDELLADDIRLKVAGRSQTVPRFPPRPLLYTTASTAARLLSPQSHRFTFILAARQPGVAAEQLARRIQQQTGLRARTTAQFKEDTVRWYLRNSEDVGDMATMLVLAMTVGLGVAGVMLYMFTYENLKQYAVLKAMGATRRLLLTMIFLQAGLCALLGTGLGIGLCAIVGELVGAAGYPFRMMWFTPLAGLLGVATVTLCAALLSMRPLQKLEPGMVFAGR